MPREVPSSMGVPGGLPAGRWAGPLTTSSTDSSRGARQPRRERLLVANPGDSTDARDREPGGRRPPTIRSTALGRWAGGVLGGLLLAGGAEAGDWPHYRGPNHDGTSKERILKAWPARGPRVLWRKPLPDGFGSFSVGAGRVFTGVKRVVGGEPQEVFVALDADTGTERWARPVGPAPHGGGTNEGDGPRSTPAIDGPFVYVLNAYQALFCLRTDDGTVVWQRDLLAEFGGVLPDFEAGASPLLHGDLVLVHGPAGAAGHKFYALAKSDGRTVWERTAPKTTHSTPVLATLHGVRQAVFFTTGGAIGLVPESGQELWRYAYNVSVPTAISPVIADNIVYHSTGYSTGGRAARVMPSGQSFRTEELWRKRNEVISFWSTPICHQGHLYGLFGHDYGFSAPLKCIELATGTEKWSRPNFGPGQVLLVDGTILMLTADGNLVLVAPTPDRYQELARFKALSGVCWNSPAISGGRIYARSIKEGVCLDVAAPPPPPWRLAAPARQPDGALQFRLDGQSSPDVTPERLGRIEVLRSTDPHAALAEWTPVTNAVVSPDATVRVPTPGGPPPARMFFRVREPQ